MATKCSDLYANIGASIIRIGLLGLYDTITIIIIRNPQTCIDNYLGRKTCSSQKSLRDPWDSAPAHAKAQTRLVFGLGPRIQNFGLRFRI